MGNSIRSGIVLTCLGLLMVAGWMLVRMDAHELRDIDGKVHGSLEQPKDAKWNVLFFMIADCPIANQYAPEIRRICSAYEAKGARCSLVYADASMEADEVRKHARDFFEFTYPAIHDTGYKLTRKAGATISSEVAVFSAGAELQYRGRINDFNAGLGTPRHSATRHDLRDALDALADGRPVPNSRTQAVGCFIPDELSEDK
jgi:hypothetical protein